MSQRVSHTTPTPLSLLFPAYWAYNIGYGLAFGAAGVFLRLPGEQERALGLLLLDRAQKWSDTTKAPRPQHTQILPPPSREKETLSVLAEISTR